MNQTIANGIIKADSALSDMKSGGSKLIQSATGRIKDWRRNRELTKLERDLARIIETSNGHAAKGKRNGDAVYHQLVKSADRKITSFCSKWNTERSDIEAQIPALAELRARTIPGRNSSPGLKLIAMFLGGGLSLLLIGAAGGVIQTGHNIVIHLAHLAHLPF